MPPPLSFPPLSRLRVSPLRVSLPASSRRRPPLAALVGFLFLNLEMMAMQIEQPFGDDADDLPLEEYCLGIERVCLDFLKRSPFR